MGAPELQVVANAVEQVATQDGAVDIIRIACDSAGRLTPRARGGVILPLSSRGFVGADDAINALERLQLDYEEGPCIEAWRLGTNVVVGDFETDGMDRWPRLAPVATALGIRAAVSAPLRSRDRSMGALSLFMRDAPGVEADTILALQALAHMTSLTLAHEEAVDGAKRVSEQLQRALDSRVIIEQAKGRVAERLGVDAAKAFELLRARARRERRNLHALSLEVTQGLLDPKTLLP